jgi:HK97 family phage prohead protease
MLLGHETKCPVGVWDRAVEDNLGLYVEGRLFPGTKRADNAVRLVREGAVSGLSIGYRALRSVRESRGRVLTEIDLFEISLVAFPMLRDARLTFIGDSYE